MHVCKGGQISEVGAKFPRKFGPPGAIFPRKFGPGGPNFRGGGAKFPVTPATDPALIPILSAIQQSMAENQNLILEEAQRSTSEEAKSPASEKAQHIA